MKRKRDWNCLPGPKRKPCHTPTDLFEHEVDFGDSSLLNRCVCRRKIWNCVWVGSLVTFHLLKESFKQTKDLHINREREIPTQNTEKESSSKLSHYTFSHKLTLVTLTHIEIFVFVHN
jgi:hypothetical protein